MNISKLITGILFAATTATFASEPSASRDKVRAAVEGAVQSEKENNHRCVVSPTLLNGATADTSPNRGVPPDASVALGFEKGGGCPSEDKKRAVVEQPGR